MTAAAIAAASERQQAALEATTPGRIVIGETSYDGGGLVIAEQRRELDADGSGIKTLETFAIWIRKSRLLNAPAVGSVFTSEDRTWRVDAVGGQSPQQIAWHIRGVRFI